MFPRLPFSLQNAHAALSLDVPAVGTSPAAPAAGGGCATNALPDGEPRRRHNAEGCLLLAVLPLQLFPGYLHDDDLGSLKKITMALSILRTRRRNG